MKYLILFISVFLIQSCVYDKEIYNDADWSFVVLGDNRSGYDTYGKLVKIADSITPAPEFSIVLGDLISEPGNELELGQFLEKSNPLRKKMDFYTAIGNHDVDSINTENIYKKYTGMEKYYTFTEKNFFFIVLDSEDIDYTGAILGEQLIWLEQQLLDATDNSNIDHIGIFIHRPFYAESGRNISNRDQLHTLFTQYNKVNFVAAAHDHHFSHKIKDGISYIISGGAGADLKSEADGSYFHFVRFNIYEEPEVINLTTTNIFGEEVANIDL